MRLIEPRGLFYLDVLALQHALVEEVARGAEPALVLVEHEAVITAGRGARIAPARAIEVERGGGVTVHGPGQLVGYPIVPIFDHDLRAHLRRIERALVRALSEIGIEAARREGATGVWVGERKIASIGIAARRWVSFHGFALNVTADRSLFQGLRPCGFEPEIMTSVAAELGVSPDPAHVRRCVVEACESVVFRAARG